MAILKCKMCGGTLKVQTGETVVTCEYCNTKQTLPKLDNERRLQMYDRANHFRRNNEFDKAMGVYEQILLENNTDAESYWSLVLCRYGIEYVEDPVLHNRIPTVNRTQKTSVLSDEDYKSAIQYADIYQKDIYEKEAKKIDEIQKKILDISEKEEPFDIFICYKETDMQGRRTPDSVLATDLYYQLIKEGYKVFFSRITLEDKLGSAYEPYIFAALNSAKIMIVLGTRAEYFNAVWVKNEWKRFLALIKDGADKVLIPAYKDMDPYDLPEDFSYLQSQDMSKLGFMQDMLRGIEKIISRSKNVQNNARNVETTADITVTSLVKRMFVFLEDQEWNKADEYCERILDIDPENAEAYIGKLLLEKKFRKFDDLLLLDLESLSKNINFKRALKFATGEFRDNLDELIKEKKEEQEKNVLQLLDEAKKCQNFDSERELHIYEKLIKEYPDDCRGWLGILKYKLYKAPEFVSSNHLSTDIQFIMDEITSLYNHAKKTKNYKKDTETDPEYMDGVLNLANSINNLMADELKKYASIKEKTLLSYPQKIKNNLINEKELINEKYQQMLGEEVEKSKISGAYTLILAILITGIIIIAFQITLPYLMAMIWIVIYFVSKAIIYVFGNISRVDNEEKRKRLENQREIEIKSVDEEINVINKELASNKKIIEEILIKSEQSNVDELYNYLQAFIDGNEMENEGHIINKIKEIEKIAENSEKKEKHIIPMGQGRSWDDCKNFLG